MLTLSQLTDMFYVFSSGTHVLYNYDKLQEIESKSLQTHDETAEATLQLVKAVGLLIS